MYMLFNHLCATGSAQLKGRGEAAEWRLQGRGCPLVMATTGLAFPCQHSRSLKRLINQPVLVVIPLVGQVKDHAATTKGSCRRARGVTTSGTCYMHKLLMSVLSNDK